MATTQQILKHGPRPSGSAALTAVRQQLSERLGKLGLRLKHDRFFAQTPDGKVAMENLIAIHPGRTNRILIIGCHLDSKKFKAFRFVGANDSASACALLTELVPHLSQQPTQRSLWFLYTDGEESFAEWSASDSLYGSRHLATELKKSGLSQNLDAFILLDMVGDRDLGIAHETNSDRRLIRATKRIAKAKGWQKHFFQYRTSVEDDHTPFHRLGIPTIDLIDFRYGRPGGTGAGSFFHTPEDTIDKISAKSLQVVGETVLELIRLVDTKWPDL